ncbi:MAG: hypothetical protein IPJ99_00665 [Betaproteobacteria bacterium]|nr:hypothetical protein [Betaproteobacteria bacterium]
MILVGIVRPVGAFIKAYLAGYPGTQMFSLSVVSAAELSQVAGDSAGGWGSPRSCRPPSTTTCAW